MQANIGDVVKLYYLGEKLWVSVEEINDKKYSGKILDHGFNYGDNIIYEEDMNI